MNKEIDLEEIVLTPEAIASWSQMARCAALGLGQIAKQRRQKIEIPNERILINDDGTLTIYVKITGIIDLSMKVPFDQWTYRLKGE